MDSIDRRLMLGAAGLAGVAAFSKLASAGPLDPPKGPVGPTGHTTDELFSRIARTQAGVAEPRIPVESHPGSESAVYVISEPGSYYLSEPLRAAPGKSGIEIAADGVTLDLHGFDLDGGAVGTTAVVATGKLRRALRVHNGTIRNWTGGGVQLLNALARVEDIEFHSLGDRAAAIGAGTISACSAYNCGGGDGTFFAWGNASFFNCTSLQSGGSAFFVPERALMMGCRAQGSSVGFVVQNGGQVIDCFASDCGLGFSGNNVLHHRCESRGCVTGFLVANGGRPLDCYSTQCQVGFLAQNGGAVERCSVDHCDTGFSMPQVGAFVAACRAATCTTPFAVAAGNSHGPIVNVAGVGDISSVPNASHPWANFVY